MHMMAMRDNGPVHLQLGGILPPNTPRHPDPPNGNVDVAGVGPGPIFPNPAGARARSQGARASRSPPRLRAGAALSQWGVQLCERDCGPRGDAAAGWWRMRMRNAVRVIWRPRVRACCATPHTRARAAAHSPHAHPPAMGAGLRLPSQASARSHISRRHKGTRTPIPCLFLTCSN